MSADSLQNNEDVNSVDNLFESTEFTLFGFKLKSNQLSKRQKELSEIESIIPPTANEDGAYVAVASGAHQIAYAQDFSGASDISDISRIRRYREMSLYPECEQAISEIANEAILSDDDFAPVELSLDDAEISDKLKKAIREEFDYILSLYDFSRQGHDLFREWYIDGRLVYHIIVDDKKKNILELRKFDPSNIKKIKEVEEKIDPRTRMKTYTTVDDYYLYDEGSGVVNNTTGSMQQKVKIHKDSIVFVPSGVLDESRKNVISYLHSAIKTVNQLKMLEDSIVVYRVSRAPERRIFYIDVGNMPNSKAEAYLQNVIAKFRNKIVYNAKTGELADSRQNIAMVEDFWLPRRCLALDTKIPLFNGGRKTLQELIDDFQIGIDNWAISVSPTGEKTIGFISWAGITKRNVEVVRVTLSNGKSFVCTPDHKILIHSAADYNLQIKVAASDLIKGDVCVTNHNDRNKDDISVCSVVYEEDTIDVGTLSIDESHSLHDYHNFCIDAGIFVMNSDGRSTEISTLPGGQGLSELGDLEYFQKKLFRSLNVPLQRLEQENTFSIGRGSEITRQEVKFSKFVSRLRKRFSELFLQPLKTQLLLKNIITEDEWFDIKEAIRINYIKDNYYAELKDAEILRDRVSSLREIDEYVGKYFSVAWVRRHILRQTESEIEDIEKEIDEEKDKYGEDAFMGPEGGDDSPPENTPPMKQNEPENDDEENEDDPGDDEPDAFKKISKQTNTG